MMRPRNKKTAESAIGSMFGDVQTNSANSSGLSVDNIRVGESHANLGKAIGLNRYLSCFPVLSRAILSVAIRMDSRGLGRLQNLRRLIATPHRLMCGVSFGVNREPGIIAPVPHYGLMPHGKPSGLLSPKGQSANPCGVSLPHGRRGKTSYSSTLGIKAMMLTLSSSVSTVFPSIPEPVFKPVTSATSDASNYDVSNDLSVIFERCATEYCSASHESDLFKRTIRLNVLRAVVEDVVQFCNESLGIARKPTCVMEA